MRFRIYISEVDGKKAVCFDTGLEPRSFARTKMSQSLIESGYIVHPDGTHEVWRAIGVNDVDGYMRVWGSPFTGKRLDLIIDELNNIYLPQEKKDALRQEALQAVSFWIRAKMLLGDTHSAFNPAAAFVCCEDGKEHPMGSVFFTPPNLSNRCLFVEGKELDRFSCPDLTGMEAAAFSAGVMLYRILSDVHPYRSDKTIFQDMREGVFLPPNLASPALDKKLCGLIQSALFLPVEKKKSTISGIDIISNFLKILMTSENGIVSFSSLFSRLSPEENEQFAKEKKRFLSKQSYFVKTRRFVLRNKQIMIGAAVGLAFIIFIFVSTTASMGRRPTTAAMASDTVITAYYEAFSSLDHIFMEACINGADKGDINAAATLFAIYRSRQVYESSGRSTIVPARVWKESGGELPSPDVFGVTDLVIEYKAGGENENMIMYQVDYLLWAPDVDFPRIRNDILTLRRDRKKNWRITEILRTER
jgi:hypothetical protein